MKYIVILGDGMADYPIAELGNRTPLEAAKTPHFDALAKKSEIGLVKTVPDGMKPGSDVANLSVLGYDPAVYYSGRSPLEAASIGIPLKDTDVTFRANLVTLGGGEDFEDAVMLDYSAGEISTAEAKELISFLAEKLDAENAKLYAGMSYRHCLVLSEGSAQTELTPPHDITGRPVRGYLPQGEGARFLLSLMEKSRKLLKDHPVNRAREAAGKRPASSLWFWGAGRKPKLDGFEKKFGKKGVMISAVDLLKGIGKLTGMQVPDVKGATGNYDTDFTAKARAALDAFDGGADFAYIHMEAPDECGHQGDLAHKIYSIEQIDQKVAGFLIPEMERRGEPFSVLLLPDHPTPVAVRTHVSDPVPYLLYRSGESASVGRAEVYSERAAADTGVFVPAGYELMKKFLMR